MRRVIVTYDVKPGCGPDLVRELLASEGVKNIRKEDGCIQYEYYFSAEDQDRVTLIEMWENEELHQAHLAGPNMAPISGIKQKYTNGQKVEILDE